MQKQRISNKTVNVCGTKSSPGEAFEFCWSSLADKHNTLPKSTRRNLKLDILIFGTPSLQDLLCKHWFAWSVWNFCCWVADVPPREMSPVAKSEEKRMFLQANFQEMLLFFKQSNFNFKGNKIVKIVSNCQSSKVWKGLAVISSKDARLQYQNIFTGNSKAVDCRLKTHNLQYLSRILLKLFLLFIVSHCSWWLYTWIWTAGLFWRRFGFLLKKKII